MRTFGRIPVSGGGLQWVVVETDALGFNDYVYITTLINCFKLNLGESPFFANVGIPAHPSVMQQIAPDYYVVLLQQRFASYFQSLTIARDASQRNPTYNVRVVTNQGAIVSMTIAA